MKIKMDNNNNGASEINDDGDENDNEMEERRICWLSFKLNYGMDSSCTTLR